MADANASLGICGLRYFKKEGNILALHKDNQKWFQRNCGQRTRDEEVTPIIPNEVSYAFGVFP
jgi:hypothetical protein